MVRNDLQNRVSFNKSQFYFVENSILYCKTGFINYYCILQGFKSSGAAKCTVKFIL